MILPEIKSDILNIIKTSHDKFPIIGIDGLLGAGKTTFAENILKSLNLNFEILSTYTFIFVSREDRNSDLNILLNHQGYYDDKKMQEVIIKLIEDKSTIQKLDNIYNHEDGKFTRNVTIDVSQKDCLILEGMYAYHPSVSDFIDYSILITGDANILFQRTIDRDKKSRNVTHNYIERFVSYNGLSYYSYLDTVINIFDRILYYYDKFKYSVIQ